MVPLRAYFQAREERLLIYDYQPNGSLFSLIHGKLFYRYKVRCLSEFVVGASSVINILIIKFSVEFTELAVTFKVLNHVLSSTWTLD